jgi:hypothetical protein
MKEDNEKEEGQVSTSRLSSLSYHVINVLIVFHHSLGDGIVIYSMINDLLTYYSRRSDVNGIVSCVPPPSYATSIINGDHRYH